MPPLYPETVSKRKLPVNFQPEHLALFQHDLERTIPPTRLLSLSDVRVSAEGLLFKGIKLLPESFAFPTELNEWKLRSTLKLLAINHLFRRRRRIDREALWITDYWSTSYFHWLSDALTRLFVMRDRLDQLLLVLPSQFETRDFVKASLQAFDVKHVDFIKPAEVLSCRNLLMPTHTAPSGHYHPELIRGVRQILSKTYGDSANQEQRLYISRRKANKRRIANEDEIIPVLRNFEFQIIHAEELSFEQQVRLFFRARYLVSNHGAGLTNMLFMPEGGRLLELRHHTDQLRNCFFILASALNLNYYYQTCRPHDEAADPHTADLLVDPNELEKNLELLLT